jgi:hypothetical protein
LKKNTKTIKVLNNFEFKMLKTNYEIKNSDEKYKTSGSTSIHRKKVQNYFIKRNKAYIQKICTRNQTRYGSRQVNYSLPVSTKITYRQTCCLSSKTMASVESKSYTIDNLVEEILSGQIKRIVIMAGAGISTPSGIPDFR